MGSHHVFVYGTLKTGFGNNRLLSNGVFVGKAVTVLPFVMRNTGGFPVVFRDRSPSPSHNIEGEVYEVNDETLRRLDSLEGHPDWYVRDETNVDIQDTGVQQSCWIYFGDKWNNDAREMTPTRRNTYAWGNR